MTYPYDVEVLDSAALFGGGAREVRHAEPLTDGTAAYRYAVVQMLTDPQPVEVRVLAHGRVIARYEHVDREWVCTYWSITTQAHCPESPIEGRHVAQRCVLCDEWLIVGDASMLDGDAVVHFACPSPPL